MISIELVPRSRESVAKELSEVEQEFDAVSMVNIPDLLRFELRSWQACAMAREAGLDRAIPHIRAMDFPLSAAPQLAQKLRGLGLGEALIVRGDPPQGLSRAVHPTTSAQLIGALKKHDPALRLYAALDPYRHSIRDELEGLEEKLAAGVDGLFTQPFFDLRLMELYADLLPKTDVFWGVSPVLTPASRRYWEVKNRAVFPPEFQPTLDYNREFAARCLEWTKARGSSVYFMPIRVNIAEYLQGLI